MPFKIDKKFFKSSHHITELKLCSIRLHDNSKFPWIILIPKKKGVTERKYLWSFMGTVHGSSRFDLIIMASKRARQLATTSRDPLVEWDNDKPTLVALREIEAGLLDKETLDRTLEEDVLMDGFSSPDSEVPETAE